MVEPVIIGDCVLYNADCMDILPALGKVDAVVTDPPYGIGVCGAEGGVTSLKSGAKDYGIQLWDSNPIGEVECNLMLSISEYQIIWGGNYFANFLPNSQCWLVWDKINGKGFSLADVELAWTSLDKASRLFSVSRTKTFQEDKSHPTQKPIGVMKWCIEQLPDGCATILDPFLGSGSTLVACAKMGKRGIGIEREPKYFDIACKRIEDAYKQPDMFVEPPKKAEQINLDISS